MFSLVAQIPVPAMTKRIRGDLKSIELVHTAANTTEYSQPNFLLYML